MPRPVGQVRHKGGDRYELRWSTPNPMGGRAIRRYKIVRASGVKEAHRLLRAEIDATPSLSDMTVEQLCEEYVKRTSPDKRTRTVEMQRGTIRLHIAPYVGKVKARRLSTPQVDELFHRLRSDGRSPYVVRQVRSLLHAAFAAGVRAKWLASNPVTDSQPPKMPARKVRPPARSEVAAVLEAAASEPANALFFRLALVTGARRGELCALRWRDIDAERCAIYISESVSLPKGGAVLTGTKTGDSRRVTIDPVTLQLLSEHMAREQAAGRAMKPDHHVWTRCESGCHPATPHRFSQAWRRACARAGVEGVTLHALRHASASYLIDKGFSIIEVSQRLGHRRTSTTQDVYGHIVSPAASALHAAALADLMSPPALDAGDG